MYLYKLIWLMPDWLSDLLLEWLTHWLVECRAPSINHTTAIVHVSLWFISVLNKTQLQNCSDSASFQSSVCVQMYNHVIIKDFNVRNEKALPEE